MSAPAADLVRCPWAGGPGPMRDYHDTEWGVPVPAGTGDDTGRESSYFERLTLEAFQSGLSWSTILAKRPAFRAAFAGFDADTVAAFTESDRARLLADAGIVRNRAKVEATIGNARAVVAVREQEGLEALIRGFAPAVAPPYDATVTTESTALSKELKRRGFRFVGPTTMHALMQALGLFDPHHPDCFRAGGRG
ncbi:DNA-3-methyladenine glycosylase I [Nocardioides insulae]|uniref:DNA-3-methyladenine glycosylase I n=1 Tax=Nocardioides insulae TaxID=394734 RepID=UPI00040D0667|nr:DNA-3-methyladenine glycosylase I [Nocardioides insulae]